MPGQRARRHPRAACDGEPEHPERRDVAVHRSYVGNVYTALEMAGFSIALLGLDEERRALIDAPADAPHFAQGAVP